MLAILPRIDLEDVFPMGYVLVLDYVDNMALGLTCNATGVV